MYSGTYRFAERIILITTQYSYTQTQCAPYAAEGFPDLNVVIGPHDIENERLMTARTNGFRNGQFTGYREEILEFLAVHRKIAEYMLTQDTLVFHGSAICVDGQAYLFTAPSGTGKSTHARLWMDKFGGRAFMVNDDKPLLRIRSGQVHVCGTPWSGVYHLNRNIAVPLHSIAILEQSPVNAIRRVSAHDAYPTLMQQSYRSSDAVRMMHQMNLVEKLSTAVPIYRLACNTEPAAANVAYAAMH